jgi:hypothetical protein
MVHFFCNATLPRITLYKVCGSLSGPDFLHTHAQPHEAGAVKPLYIWKCFSASFFDVCEQLLKSMESAATSVHFPPFWPKAPSVALKPFIQVKAGPFTHAFKKACEFETELDAKLLVTSTGLGVSDGFSATGDEDSESDKIRRRNARRSQTSGSGAGDVGPAHDFVFQVTGDGDGDGNSDLCHHHEFVIGCNQRGVSESSEALCRAGGAGATKQPCSRTKGTFSNWKMQTINPWISKSDSCLKEETWEGVDMGDGIAVFASAQAAFGAVKKMSALFTSALTASIFCDTFAQVDTSIINDFECTCRRWTQQQQLYKQHSGCIRQTFDELCRRSQAARAVQSWGTTAVASECFCNIERRCCCLRKRRISRLL